MVWQNILREEWKPILSISAVVYGLQFLFLVRAAFPASPPTFHVPLL
jgi:ubiquitin-protein ligase